jgi:hypothetical protein
MYAQSQQIEKHPGVTYLTLLQDVFQSVDFERT